MIDLHLGRDGPPCTLGFLYLFLGRLDICAKRISPGRESECPRLIFTLGNLSFPHGHTKASLLLPPIEGIIHVHFKVGGDFHLFDLFRDLAVRVHLDCATISSHLGQSSKKLTLDLLDSRISPPGLGLLAIAFILSLKRIDTDSVILPRRPYGTPEVRFKRLSHARTVRLQPLIPNPLTRHATNLVHAFVDPLGGLFEREVVVDREEVDLARDEEFEEAAVEGRVVAFALASAGFVLDPFVPAIGGDQRGVKREAVRPTSLRLAGPPMNGSAMARRSVDQTHTHDLFLSIPRSDGGLGRHGG